MNRIFLSLIISAMPLIAFADARTDVLAVFNNIKSALGVAVPIAIALALIYFIWGVIKYVISQDEEEKTKARQQIIYGIIGMFIIVAIWGIVSFIANYLGVTPADTTTIPKVF